MAALKTDIIAYAQSLGFDRIGVSSAEPMGLAEKSLGEWIENGNAGEMGYMGKNWKARARPGELLSGAKSVIALAVSYYNDDAERGRRGESEKQQRPASPCLRVPASGRIARYAWGKDYHKVLKKRLDALVRYIEALAPEARCKTYVDTGPLLERAVAQKAGLGFIGKNTMLITRGLGSYVFLASVLTTLELPSDTPDARSCGSCTLCIDACPTQAITEPYHLDARRCISYLTIESKQQTPEELRSKMGDWVFGCDICQEVCPHNTRLPPTPVAEFRPEAGVGPSLKLADVFSLNSETEFAIRFAGTSLKRAKHHGLQRNAQVVAENLTTPIT